MSADVQDLYKLTRELDSLARQIEAMAQQIAQAKTVRDFDGDRRKNLLAEYVTPLLADNSATAAESMARSNPEYQKRFKELSVDLMAAYATIAKESGLQARFEACRSILSCQKAAMQL